MESVVKPLVEHGFIRERLKDELREFPFSHLEIDYFMPYDRAAECIRVSVSFIHLLEIAFSDRLALDPEQYAQLVESKLQVMVAELKDRMTAAKPPSG